MSGYRLSAPAGTAIDRARTLGFRFNGRALQGLAGDTLASALLANGITLIGRSFKYHRPRGIVSCGVEEPTGLLDVGDGAHRIANTRATDIALKDGLTAVTGNAWPSVERDLGAVNSRLGRYFGAGFYYKTFMWPTWHLFEPTIRRMAGLGHAGEGADPDRYEEVSLRAEVLVVGSGLAGLEAAAAAAEQGRQVILVESEAWAGGWAATVAAGTSAAAAEMRQRLVSLSERIQRAGVSMHFATTIFGLYDHGLATAVQIGSGPVRERVLKIRAQRIILATGALERPVLFPDNDRPGVMFAHGAERYAAHYGVATGRRIVLASACDHGLAVAERLRSWSVQIAEVLDLRRDTCVVGIRGTHSLSGVEISKMDGTGRRMIEADALLHVAGLTPNVSLHSQAGGGLTWDQSSAMFVPSRPGRDTVAVGACAGAFEVESALEHARAIGRGHAAPAPVAGVGSVLADTLATKPVLGRRKVFVDLQNDVTASDVAQAARENYRSVEHLKRYTTIGMATDQGKTSNVNAILLMGKATRRRPDEVGTTKFRPPYKPVTFGAIVAGRTGERYRPLRRLPAHAFHVARGASFEEFGGWLRPAAYPVGGETLEDAAQREAVHTRRSVCLFDGSPLGKMEVVGPDAAAFLDLMYVEPMSTLAVGHARYGVLCNENGVVIEDGIVTRLGPEHFWVNTASAGAERTALVFEEWLQCEFTNLRVMIQPVVSQWGNITVAGPKTWRLLKAAGFDDSLSPGSMKYMTMREVPFGGTRVRVLRTSFSGELSYEINLPSLYSLSLLERLWALGAEFEVGVHGVESLMLMRLEKGYVHVGADTDGTTLPQDIGSARKLEKKAANFVGRRSLFRPAGQDPTRMQLVGLLSKDVGSKLAVGAHIAAARPPSKVEGYVTSAGYSPHLQKPIALAMLQGGSKRVGERLRVFHLGCEMAAEVVSLPFLDPAGEHLNG